MLHLELKTWLRLHKIDILTAENWLHKKINPHFIFRSRSKTSTHFVLNCALNGNKCNASYTDNSVLFGPPCCMLNYRSVGQLWCSTSTPGHSTRMSFACVASTSMTSMTGGAIHDEAFFLRRVEGDGGSRPVHRVRRRFGISRFFHFLVIDLFQFPSFSTYLQC